MSGQSVKQRTKSWLDSHPDFPNADESHLATARRMKAEGVCEDAPEKTIGRYVGQWVREQADREAQDDEATAPAESPLDEPPDEAVGLEVVERRDNVISTPSSDHDPGDFYRVFIPCLGKAIKVDGETARSIRRDYSNEIGSGDTFSELNDKYGWRPDVMKQFVRVVMDWVHDMDRYTDDEIANTETSELVRSTLQEKRGEYIRERNKEVWRQIKSDAEKWRAFEYEKARPLITQVKSTPIDERTHTYSQGKLDDFVMVPHVTDGHLDQLNADQTGFAENKKRWLDCLHQNLRRAERFGQPRKIILPLGNDLWNSDTADHTTTAGTPQDQDLVGKDAFFEVADAGVEAIELCREVAPTEVKVVPGNHDMKTCWLYYWSIREKYDGIDDVQVTGDADTFQITRSGRNLLCWTHGDKVRGGETKRNQFLSSYLLHNAAEHVAECTHFFVMLGHLHFIAEKDEGVHTLQGGSTAKADAWHQRNAYETSQACQTAYVFDDDGGQSVRFTAYADRAA